MGSRPDSGKRLAERTGKRFGIVDSPGETTTAGGTRGDSLAAGNERELPRTTARLRVRRARGRHRRWRKCWPKRLDLPRSGGDDGEEEHLNVRGAPEPTDAPVTRGCRHGGAKPGRADEAAAAQRAGHAQNQRSRTPPRRQSRRQPTAPPLAPLARRRKHRCPRRRPDRHAKAQRSPSRRQRYCAAPWHGTSPGRGWTRSGSSQ